MQDAATNNKRIAKNTLVLYLRMLVMMFISFFTSRLMLQILGIDNYGIQNVVGGFVSMFGIVTASMSNAISRFITIELGKGKQGRCKLVFSTAISVQIFMALILFVLLEVIGVWYMYNVMKIPDGRFDAAMVVFQTAIVGSIIHLILLPFNASIIAHERMSAFAWLSILDVILKLLILYVLYVIPFDVLKTYAVLGLFVSFIHQGINIWYCRKNFEECHYEFTFDKPLFKEILGFASWNFLGEGTWILNNQGISMLLNYHFGVVVNAAQGVANQLNQAVQKFVRGFTTSVNPQIYKSFAAGDIDYCFNLVCRAGRFSYYLMFVFALPVMLETEQILDLWLVEVPAYASTFARWTIASTLALTLSNPLIRMQFATGNIKHYQIVASSISITPFFFSAILFAFGFPAVTAFVTYFLAYFVLIFVRVFLVDEIVKIPKRFYFKDVVWRLTYVSFIALLIPALIRLLMGESILRLIIICGISAITASISIYCLGLHKGEQDFFVSFIKSKLINKLLKNGKV